LETGVLPPADAELHLLSISFDPDYDRPEVLRDFGRVFVQDRGQGRFAHWELATGSAEQIDGRRGAREVRSIER
jgi:protein SCO1/2